MAFDYLLKYLWFVNSGTFFEKLNNFSGFLKTFYVNKIVHNLHHCTHTHLLNCDYENQDVYLLYVERETFDNHVMM